MLDSVLECKGPGDINRFDFECGVRMFVTREKILNLAMIHLSFGPAVEGCSEPELLAQVASKVMTELLGRTDIWQKHMSDQVLHVFFRDHQGIS